MKLDYEEITPCLKEVTKVWDEMLQADESKKFTKSSLLKAVKDGMFFLIFYNQPENNFLVLL